MVPGGRRLLVLAACLLVAASCTGGDSGSAPRPTAEPVGLVDAPARYDATWLVDAEAVGADGPGFPYLYREVVDDRAGRYLVQSANHLATQQADEIVFCAAIYRVDPYCASAPRAENTPPVYAYPLQLVRSWGPNQLYDLAGWREINLVVDTEPGAWSRRADVVRDVPVECFTVVGETAAARTGFEICFTDDELHLVASVDLQGDLVFEIDLQSYERQLAPDAFETGLEEFIEAKPSLQDQLITLFPEIPAPRPTPTPDPSAPADEG